MLRERLEQQKSKSDDRIQKITAEGNQRLQQLKDSIAELRQNLEEKDLEKEAACRKVIRTV
jgi:DNA-binding PadR family transcriptional regulator